MLQRPDFPVLAPVAAGQGKTVAVIGAGLVGLSSALWLQMAGHQVVLVDRHAPDDESAWRSAASYGNACTVAFSACLPVAMPGILKQVPGMLLDRRGPLSIFWRDLPRLAPWLLSFVAASRTREVDRIVGVLGQLLAAAEAGIAPLVEDAGAGALLRRTGCLYLYRNEAEFRREQQAIAWREREGVAMRVLDAAEIREREPRLAPLYYKGLEFLKEYSFDTPHAYVRALFARFIQRGGRFLQAEVRGISRKDGQLAVHHAGEHLPCERLVIAAGAWSGRVAAMVGDRVRLDTERGYHVFFPGAGEYLHAPTCYPAYGFYMTPLADGMRVAGTVELGGLDAPFRKVRTDVMASRAKELLPALGEPGETWLGFRPSMPDSLPVIGASPSDPRVIHAYGHGHIGLTLSGITGRMVAHIINQQAMPVDMHALRPDRY